MTDEPMAGRLDLSSANAVAQSAIETARDQGIPPLAVVVLDVAGDVITAQRDDGASMFRIDVATGKAWAAAAMGCSSADLATRATDNPVFFTALASTAGGHFLPQPGAVLIRDREGTLLGAVGASGGTGAEDAACCAAGVRAVGLIVDE